MSLSMILDLMAGSPKSHTRTAHRLSHRCKKSISWCGTELGEMGWQAAENQLACTVTKIIWNTLVWQEKSKINEKMHDDEGGMDDTRLKLTMSKKNHTTNLALKKHSHTYTVFPPLSLSSLSLVMCFLVSDKCAYCIFQQNLSEWKHEKWVKNTKCRPASSTKIY